MGWLSKIERKFTWLAVHGLLKCLAMIGAIVYGISWTNPWIGQQLDFNKAAILEGEVWRVVTFPFAPSSAGPGALSLLFFVFGVMFAFLMSDALERVWGVVRTSLFVTTGYLTSLAGCFFCPQIPEMPGILLFSTVFLAFAWHYPDFTLRLFFFIPVPCHVLAKITLALLALASIANPISIPFSLAAHANLMIWVVPEWWAAFRLRRKAGTNRRTFTKKLRPLSEAFHHCAVCQRTEHDGRHLEFRVGADGREYCEEHLPE